MNKIEGRIIKGIGGLYHVATDDGVYKCSARGVFRKKNLTPLIGDNVTVQIQNESEKTGSVHEIQERKNSLIRPRVANIDRAIIVTAPSNPPINLELLDRLLILAEDVETDILICINKSDLLTHEVQAITEQYKAIGYDVIYTNAMEGTGIEDLKSRLTGKVSVFAGPSGVGKSSLVNALLPYTAAETGELSAKISRGKHTTRHAEIIEVFENSYIVDSPGFSSLTTDHIPKDKLPSLFPEFRPFLDDCRFTDCSHLNEPDCSVKAQIGNGISSQRYSRYVSFANELKNQTAY